MEVKQPLSEFYCQNPIHVSVKEIKDENKIAARNKCGLHDKFVDIKDSSKDPTLAYVDSPAVKTKMDLEQRRREENFQEFRKTEEKQGNHKDGMQRLKEREDCFLRVAYKEHDGKTKRALQDARRKEMLDYNMHTFGKVSIGVHGKELPKYNDDPEKK